MEKLCKTVVKLFYLISKRQGWHKKYVYHSGKPAISFIQTDTRSKYHTRVVFNNNIEVWTVCVCLITVGTVKSKYSRVVEQPALCKTYIIRHLIVSNFL